LNPSTYIPIIIMWIIIIYVLLRNRRAVVVRQIIKEVTDGAILIENDGKIAAINLDFVIRIREYPKNKKGKKKLVVG